MSKKKEALSVEDFEKMLVDALKDNETLKDSLETQIKLNLHLNQQVAKLLELAEAQFKQNCVNQLHIEHLKGKLSTIQDLCSLNSQFDDAQTAQRDSTINGDVSMDCDIGQ